MINVSVFDRVINVMLSVEERMSRNIHRVFTLVIENLHLGWWQEGNIHSTIVGGMNTIDRS